MQKKAISLSIAGYLSQNILIIPFQVDFYAEVIRSVRNEILNTLHENPEIIGLIIDLSQVKIIDLENMLSLEEIQKAAIMLGVDAYLVGLKPYLALTLVELGYDAKHLNMALNIESANTLIYTKKKKRMKND